MMPASPPASHYPLVVQWSDEDGVFVVKVPDLPGCMAHGDSPEAAVREAQVAIQLWLDTCREFGDPIPLPTLRLPV